MEGKPHSETPPPWKSISGQTLDLGMKAGFQGSPGSVTVRLDTTNSLQGNVSR